MSQSRQIKRLADYQAPSFLTHSIELEFVLDPAATQVTAISKISRQGAHQLPLQLDGHGFELLGIWLNNVPLTDYQQTDEQLILAQLPDEFELKIVTQLNPAENTALEGLYLSGGAYCTQCEAEGFRRITYYQDRPDVLAVFTTHIVADAKSYPHLLSNGNLIADTLLENGQRRVSWQDPFPKPCYLFALVAGDFDELADSYTTGSGREVALKFYVDKGNRQRAVFALESLKRAMLWDEQEFGLEYDLDIYMVVAVDFFNMGAMENKGLNVFNSKYVLANPQTATDVDYFNIESIIGHEYFHNWTGNRVTCRDWFQLSLKEGLTVFRDQQFSAAMGSPTLCRIDAIKTIRTAQFAEDAGPMAHPIRPEQVLEMNNFYTVTVYDKGAEVIRMQHTLLGQAGFRRGMDLYFQRFDGKAVTCDDFVQAMQDANQFDLSQFRRWYQQAGTPELSVTTTQDDALASFTLTLQQQTDATADGSPKLPLVLPVRLELISADLNYRKQHLLVLTEERQSFVFEQVPANVRAVVLADFSAPVKLVQQISLDDLLFIAANASDGVARWDAMQQIWSDMVRQSVDAADPVMIPASLLSMFRQLLDQPLEDLEFTAELLALPGFDTLAEQYPQIPVDGILNTLQSFRQQIAKALTAELSRCYQRLPRQPYQYQSTQVGIRKLQSLCLGYLAQSISTAGSVPENAVVTALLQQHYLQADNMTDRQATLTAAVQAGLELAQPLLLDLLEKDGRDPLIFDKWASLQVSLPTTKVFEIIENIVNYPQFSWNNPNRVRAVFSAFSHYNPQQFHRADGRGYQLLASIVGKIDHSNPQLAARLVTPLLSWKRYDEARQHLIQQQLGQLRDQPGLSNDLFEKVARSLS
ncbi:aminopeptidase N [Rheinheimera sp. SA_1]|uniref:aminopeptidase N n=1 Tax=Rheinheimera sp. SA_1 TaxID=1827365 RepID=UPI0008005DF7|nr:aminopeptidase N [Rheinheimera sp. SA_1]OBP15024.1 aminopeptidase N [Rheinheimera sp. SA_1]